MRTRPLFDRDDWWDDTGFFWGLHTLLDPVRVPYFRDALAPCGSPPKVLDVGCGAGFVAEALAATGAEVVGVDIVPGPLRAVIRRPGHGRYLRADAERLPFAAAAFDAVVVSEVLEHVPDPGRVVAEAARVLRRGGRMLFGGPNRTRLSKLVLVDLAQRLRVTRVLPADLHEWAAFVGPARLARLAAPVGLEVVDVTGVKLPLRALPAALAALAALRRGRVDHGEAGTRIRLATGGLGTFAYLATLERR